MEDIEQLGKIIESQKLFIKNFEAGVKQNTGPDKYKLAVELEMLKVSLVFYETKLKNLTS